MTENLSSPARVRVARKPKVDTSALAFSRSKRALFLSAFALLGSSASLYFNEAFVAFCGFQ